MKLYHIVFSGIVALGLLGGCQGCRKKNGATESAPIPKGTIYGNVTEFPGPFTDTTDITYYDLAVNYDPQNKQVGIICLQAPNAAGKRLPALYISPINTPSWREIGTSFFAQHANARGMLLEMPMKSVMFCAVHHDTTPSTSSIYKTIDGGQTWSDVVLSVPGAITCIASSGDTLYRWGGMNGTTPFREEWNSATGTFTSASLPTVPASPQYAVPRGGNVLYGSMESPLFGTIYTGGPGGRNWGELLPQQSLSLLMGEEVLFADGTYGPTVQSSAPALMLGRWGYRDSSGYSRYPSTIAQPVAAAYGHKWRWWIVDAANEVWTYDTDYMAHPPNARGWERIYGGVYPSFHASTKKNNVHFTSGPELTTWVVSEGTTLIVHTWEY